MVADVIDVPELFFTVAVTVALRVFVVVLAWAVTTPEEALIEKPDPEME